MANVGQNIVPLANLPTPPPATIAASGNWNSGAYTSGGFPGLAIGCTLSQTGTLSLQRYLDPAGTIPIGAAVSVALAANTANSVAVRDGVPFASWIVTVTNTGGGTANLTNVYILQSTQ